MSKAVLKIRKKPVPSIIERVRYVVGKMRFNPDFSSPNPALATITLQVNNLETAFENAIYGGTNLTALVRTEKKKMLHLMLLLTSYVQYTSGGNESKIRSAGYDIKGAGTKVGVLPPPGNVRAEFGKHPGEIDVKWNAVARRRDYSVQMSVDPTREDSWTEIPHDKSGKLRVTVGNLVSGKVYWFRVFTHSTAGVSGPSDVTSHRAA